MRICFGLFRVLLVACTVMSLSSEVQAAPVPWRFEGTVTGFYGPSSSPNSCGPGEECLLAEFIPLGSHIAVELSYDATAPSLPGCPQYYPGAIGAIRTEVNGYTIVAPANGVHTWINGGAGGGLCRDLNTGLEVVHGSGGFFEGEGFDYDGRILMSAFGPSSGLYGLLTGVRASGPLTEQPASLRYASTVFSFVEPVVNNTQRTRYGGFNATLVAVPVPAPPIAMLLVPALCLCLRRRRSQ